MKSKWKAYFLSFCFAGALTHFIIICAYLVKPGTYSGFYSYPFFEQNWSLFVPPPNSNYNLYVYDKDHELEKTDVFKAILNEHQKNRLKGYEPMLVALSNSIHYFEKDAEEQKFDNGKVEGNRNFSIIEKFSKNYLKSTGKKHSENAKIILMVRSVSTGKQRVYFN